MYRLVTLTIAVLIAQEALAQTGTVGSTGTTGTTGTTTGGTSCKKNADCQPFATCRMPDFWNYPQIWPPCPHVGTCVCLDNYINAANGSCYQIVNLNYLDRCSNQFYERYDVRFRCNTTHVICNSPTWNDYGRGYCELAPTPTIAPVPIVIVPVPTVICQSVGFLAFCDSKTTCCAANTGLTCQNKAANSNASYAQCHCTRKSDIFDSSLGYCRPRVYGDICVTTDECASGLISNTGYECRLGRCRCVTGYDPVDNLYWNETTRTTYMRRICIINTAVSWVPTGQSCTMDPQLFAGIVSTRVCHPRAFCHLCQDKRAGYTVGQSTPVVGTCREYNCAGDAQCGNNGKCNNWGIQVDPPCERATCDCNWNLGMYKDRFSRCSAYQALSLGDRCIVPDITTQLWNWYPNNEDWDDDKDCEYPMGTSVTGGYAGYNWGVVKCNLPYIEDADGNCVRNDDLQYQWQQFLGYGADCDNNDLRYPLRTCDASRGLTCNAGKCTCAATQTCGTSGAYAGCSNSVASSPNLWDGQRCRARGFGDQCQSNTDCCGGTCNGNTCGCASGLTAVQYSTVSQIQNGGNSIQNQVMTNNYCFRNVTIVNKGGECHLDPITWNCAANQKYGWSQVNLNPLVCANGLVCMRCPQDYSPDDEGFGVCRSFNQIPDTRPSPLRPCGAASGPGGIGGTPGSTGGSWVNGRWVAGNWNAASSTVAQSLVVAILAVIAALAF